MQEIKKNHWELVQCHSLVIPQRPTWVMEKQQSEEQKAKKEVQEPKTEKISKK